MNTYQAGQQWAREWCEAVFRREGMEAVQDWAKSQLADTMAAIREADDEPDFFGSLYDSEEEAEAAYQRLNGIASYLRFAKA